MRVCIYVYVCMCVDMYIYIYVYVYVYAYLCIDCGSQYQYFRSCMRMCPISLLHAHVSQVFLNTCMRVCGGIGSGGFSACSRLALVAGVGGYVLAGVEIGVLSCIFLYFCGC